MAKFKRPSRKMNKYESMALQKERKEYFLKGRGKFVYRNNVNGELMLPKPTESGQIKVGKNEEWEGDDYYMMLVNAGMAINVRTIVSVEDHERNQKMLNEQILIVDQPERVTAQGVVEQVIVLPENKKKKVVEQTKIQEQKPAEDKLLIEDPMAGVTILN